MVSWIPFLGREGVFNTALDPTEVNSLRLFNQAFLPVADISIVNPSFEPPYGYRDYRDLPGRASNARSKHDKSPYLWAEAYGNLTTVF